jgi:NitT/TauT family transport system substrate-binding protein
MSRSITWIIREGIIAAILLATVNPSAALTRIKLSTVQSFGAIVTYIARDKGYFKEQGVDVDINFMNSSANAVALLGQGELQVMEGGVAVGFFNALGKGLPMIMTSDRVSTPIGHKLLVRADLKGKINSVADLKGRNVGTNAIGAVTTYELGKVLAKSGLTLKDVELKTLGFPQMSAALKNGAIDATLQIPPFEAAIEDQGIGFPIAAVDDVVEPSPMTIAASFVNTDWAAKNKEAMRGFFVAYMRATREYCLAYHGGANRREVMEIALKNGLDRSIDHIDKNIWTGRNMSGAVNMKSVLDQQDWYVKTGLVTAPQSPGRMYTTEFIDYANQKLGPPPAVNPQSKLPGCR